MKSGQHFYIIYIVIISCLFLNSFIFWRDDVFNSLYVNSGLEQTELLGQTLMNNTTVKDNLDTDILDNAKFLVLKKNVKHFDYNLICQDAETISQLGGSASLAPLCAVGNGSPFTRASAQK